MECVAIIPCEYTEVVHPMAIEWTLAMHIVWTICAYTM